MEFEVDLNALRARRSEKWAMFPADVLPAFVAEMDFALAPAVRAALANAIENGDCGYAHPESLKASFVRFAQERFGWSVDASAAFVVPDVMVGISESLKLLSRPGDGVVINPPVYPPFFEVIRSVGRRVVEVPLAHDDPDKPWELDFDRLESAFKNGASAFLLCNPHNPVGRVWSKNDLKVIAELAARHGVGVISDEVHAPLTMPGFVFTPYLNVCGTSAQALAVTSASKAFNVAGLKCALTVAASPELSDALGDEFKRRPSDIAWRVGHLGVLASIAAFEGSADWLDAVRAYLDANRHTLVTLLAQRLPGARYVQPEAGYLAWIDCRALGLGDDPARRFLERGRVALEHGLKFGSQGAGFVRLNFGTSAALLEEIVERMTRAL